VFNTTIITASSVVLQSFFASLAGYTFAKCSFRGREALFTFTLATVMIPSAVGMIPNYILMSRIGWIDTWWELIIPGAANTFGIFWMRQYIGTVPDELIDAGRIDGVGEFGLYWRIVVPVIKPALVSLAIFIFMGTWNSYLAPLVYLRDMTKWTVQLIVAQLGSGGNIVRYDLLAAGSVLATLPILVFFFALQKQFVAGIMAGAIK
jgi:cellobiose transport system permease protein